MVFSVKPVSTSLLLGLLVFSQSPVSLADDDDNSSGNPGFVVTQAKWDQEKSRIRVSGYGTNQSSVSLSLLNDASILGTSEVRRSRWRITSTVQNLASCDVKLLQQANNSSQQIITRLEDCEIDTAESPSPTPTPNPTPVENSEYTLLANNDLGMHCADQDYRVFSILPPYNVVNAQLLRKGAEPDLLSDQDGVTLSYQAIESNYFDDLAAIDAEPIDTTSITRSGDNIPANGMQAQIFKNNFWIEGTLPSI